MTWRVLRKGMGCSLALVASCRSQLAEPAPPPASYELAQAPPGARGARAAGTDAAPNVHELAEPDPDDGEGEADEADGGVLGDAGLGVEIDAGPGVAL